MSKVNNNDMGKSSKSHSRKSDKETHTPMLKIFKDMMLLEKNDPEKANLLKERERNKKRKQYSSSRLKSDHTINRSCESSISEHHKGLHDLENRQYNVQCHGIRSRLSNMMAAKEVKTEDTGSCASCALKKLATSEYTCIACLGIIFTITVIVAFCLVFKSNPCPKKPPPTTSKPCNTKPCSVKDFDDVGLKEGFEDRNDWDDSKLDRYGELSELDDQVAKGLNEGRTNKYGDLSKILDVAKLNYGKSSERLKGFYKKLLQTDDQIKNLKKGALKFAFPNKNPERAKRSLRHHRFHFNKDFNNNNDINSKRDKSRRFKRYPNHTMPSSFVIEKKKLLIHLPQEKKKVPKCSHAPKDSKSHETQLKHPFYKHTQRLDELLDQFLDTNLPQIFSDPFNIGSLFKNNKIEHDTSKPTTVTRKKDVNVDILSDNVETSEANDFFRISSAYKTEPNFLLEVTSVVGLPRKLPTKPRLQRAPTLRKLMQAYEDDEDNLGYDDLKEVLTDDSESRDDAEGIDRNKRSYETDTSPTKSNPPGGKIPNWKGPFPLYPDELETMINKGSVEDPNDPNKQVRTMGTSSSTNDASFNDVEYIEDYLTNAYARLVHMAQAYSDYGVLDEKKEAKHDTPTPQGQNIEHRVKLSLDVPKLQKKFIHKFRTATTESWRKVAATATNGDEIVSLKEGFSIPKLLEKHIKFKDAPQKSSPQVVNSELDEHLKKLMPSFSHKDSMSHSAKTEVPDLDKHLKDLLPSPSGTENLPIPVQVLNKKKSSKRLLDFISINIDGSSLAKDIKKRSIEAFDADFTSTTKDNEIFSIEMGTNSNLSSNKNDKPITLDYSFGNNKPKNIIEATVSDKPSSTPQNMKYRAFKRRSLKSIDIETIDKVLGIDDHVTFEDLTTEIITKYEKLEKNMVSKNASFKTFNTIIINNNDAVIGMDANIIGKSTTDSSTIAPLTSQFITSINVPFSIELENSTYDLSANESKIIGESTTKTATKFSNGSKINGQLDKDSQKSILNIINMVNTRNNTKESDNGLDLSDFFRMISTWFSSLASASLDDNDDHSGTMSPIMKLKASEIPHFKAKDNNNDSDIQFPIYDSDMIENIGHRSRVLMSVDEAIGPVNITEGKKEMDNVDSNNGKNQDKRAGFKENNSTDIPEPNSVLTTTEDNANTPDTDKNLVDNRTLVKRSIGDSGLVFWSDLYDDDEYGIKIDLLEKELEERNSNKGKEFMKRSKNWFQDKVKSIAGNFKGFRNDPTKINAKGAFNKNPKNSRMFKRETKMDKNDGTQENPSSFAELSVKMRNICKQAAKAVQDTRKMQVRESKADSVTDGLMQQLVRMMSDLVDFQVKQKTCVKLPADLQNFLEWITSPNQDRQTSREIKLQDDVLGDEQYEKDEDDNTLVVQDKSECMETLHAVEDLIQQFDQMDDEDKSKMTGVRQYLTNQQDFLNKQITMLDEYNFSNMYANQQPLRYRRHITKKPELNRNKLKRRMKRRLGDILRNFQKKHKSTTISSKTTDVTKSSKSDVKTDAVNENTKEKDANVHEEHKDIGKTSRLNVEVADKTIKSHKTVEINERDTKKSNFQDDFIINLNSNKNNKKYASNKGFDEDFAENYNNLKDKFNVEEFEKNENLEKDGVQDLYSKSERIERNLQDVYYRALNEAKKVTITTAKGVDKNL